MQRYFECTKSHVLLCKVWIEAPRNDMNLISLIADCDSRLQLNICIDYFPMRILEIYEVSRLGPDRDLC